MATIIDSNHTIFSTERLKNFPQNNTRFKIACNQEHCNLRDLDALKNDLCPQGLSYETGAVVPFSPVFV